MGMWACVSGERRGWLGISHVPQDVTMVQKATTWTMRRMCVMQRRIKHWQCHEFGPFQSLCKASRTGGGGREEGEETGTK